VSGIDNIIKPAQTVLNSDINCIFVRKLERNITFWWQEIRVHKCIRRFLRTLNHRIHGLNHRVDRVLGFFSSRPNWDPRSPHLQTGVFPPPLVPLGDTLTRGRGDEGSQFVRGDRPCGTLGTYLVLCA
jgi:hypothetical protein